MGLSNGKPSASRTSPASSANPHSGSSSPANSSPSGQPWRRRSDDPTRAPLRSAFLGATMADPGPLGGSAVDQLHVLGHTPDHIDRQPIPAKGPRHLPRDDKSR